MKYPGGRYWWGSNVTCCSLPRLAQCVKLLMALAIFLSYPIQFYVPKSILTPLVAAKFSNPRHKFIASHLFITAMVGLTCKLWLRPYNFCTASVSFLSLMFSDDIENKIWWKIFWNIRVIFKSSVYTCNCTMYNFVHGNFNYRSFVSTNKIRT